MARFKEKFSTFFFGLTVGLLIGCAIFIFKLDDYVKNFQFSDSKKPAFEETTDLTDGTKPKKDLKKKITLAENKKGKDNDQKDSLAVAETNADSSGSEVMDIDASSSENISVLKEELVGVKNVKVKGAEEGKTSKKDSLAASVAGVAEPNPNEFLVIEFWKTPLNSKGYKMSRNKVVLYGLQEQNVDIVKLNDNYYLKNNNLVYRISYSNEFHKMERVSESSILDRMN
ncbi:MAG: hypothetical protein IAF38_12800 [Bacteroidia bacterium]|nr:hypothetical protein [Bacteroidia bacterium]